MTMIEVLGGYCVVVYEVVAELSGCNQLGSWVLVLAQRQLVARNRNATRKRTERPWSAES